MNTYKLQKFTEEIVEIYERGDIKAPVHLSKGNEDQLIDIFQEYNEGDWIFSTWRSHYHWLLSGREPELLKEQILEGHSMHIFDDKFFTSSIVAGISPIALGVAYALRMRNSKRKVFCFLGDMGASTGLSYECFKFASGHVLPIKYVIEDNELSVESPTKETWGLKYKTVVVHYEYERKFPHAGTGTFILF